LDLTKKSLAVKFIIPLFVLLYIFYLLLADSRKLYYYLQFKTWLNNLPEAVTSDVRFVSYTVKPGDNYWNLANRFGLNIDTLVSLAPKQISQNIHNIPIGLEMKIPVVDGIRYKQRSNETPAEIAANYMISSYDVLKLDEQSDASGQVFFLKGASFSLSERLDKLGTLFLNPLQGQRYRITSLFGYRIHPIRKTRHFHKGIDLGAATGTPVYAAMGGRIVYAAYASGYGKLIVIHHSKKAYRTKYAHLSRIRVRPGLKVCRQQLIGFVGNTGTSTGSHLHFEVLRHHRNIDPRGVTDLH